MQYILRNSVTFVAEYPSGTGEPDIQEPVVLKPGTVVEDLVPGRQNPYEMVKHVRLLLPVQICEDPLVYVGSVLLNTSDLNPISQ